MSSYSDHLTILKKKKENFLIGTTPAFMYTLFTRKYCVQAIFHSVRSTKRLCKAPSSVHRDSSSQSGSMYLSRFVRSHHHHVSVHVRRSIPALSRKSPLDSMTVLNSNAIIFGIDQRFCSTKPVSNDPIPEELLDHHSKRTHEHRREVAHNHPPPENVKHPYDDASFEYGDERLTDDNEFTVADDAIEHEMYHVLIKDKEEYYVDKSRPKYEDYTMPHAIWTKEELDSVRVTHKPPERRADKLAYGMVQMMRFGFDLFSGYSIAQLPGIRRVFKFSTNMVLLRLVFLETVAGVPGMMFGMVRHMNSLRRLERDRGWIKTLLSEAENERMHLLVCMSLYKPGRFMRMMVLIVQGVMSNFLFISYLISPRFCHSLVGYLEEQAVITYSHLLHAIDEGTYPLFYDRASDLAIKYWKLPRDAVWRDVILAIRADEANHRDVNHTLSDLTDDPKAVNPFRKKH